MFSDNTVPLLSGPPNVSEGVAYRPPSAASLPADDNRSALGLEARLRLGEHLYLMFEFVIGSIYAYGPLMTYPIYNLVVRHGTVAEASPSVVSFWMFFMKLMVQPVHSLGVRACGQSLRSLQAFVIGLFSACICGLFFAADGTSSLGVVIGVCSLNLVSSRILGGTLFTVPLEDMIKVRTFVYDAAAQAGCLWVPLVGMLLGSELGREYGAVRFLALAMPLGVGLAAWLLLPPAGFFDASRMYEEQQKLLQTPEDSEAPWGRSSKHMVQHCSTASTASGSWEDLSDDEDAEVLANVPLRPWADARFRVLAATCFLNWWSFSFFGYTAFPTLIQEAGGPSLEAIGSLYCIEGLVCCCCMAVILPRLRSHLFVLFFGSGLTLLALPPIAVCLMPHVHWSGYFAALLCMDVCGGISNTMTGVVLLRCLSWELLPSFYSDVSAIGGIITAVSMGQLAMHEYLGWVSTAVLSHGLVFVIVGLVYLTHIPAIKDIYAACV